MKFVMQKLVIVLSLLCLAACGPTSSLTKPVGNTYKPENESRLTIRTLQQSLSEQPNDPFIIGQLGDAYYDEYFKQRNDTDLNQAIYYYNQYLTSSTENKSVVVRLYQLYLEKRYAANNNDIETQKTIERLYTRYPILRETSFNGPSQINALWLMKDKDKLVSRLPEIRRLFKLGLKESPYAHSSYLYLARIFDIEKHKLLALASVRLGLKKQPDNVQLLTEMGYLLQEYVHPNQCVLYPKRINEMMTVYKKLAKIDPHNIEANYGLSDAFLYTGRNKLRLYQARKIYKKQPNLDNKILLAGALSDTEAYDEAEKLFKEAIAEAPRSTHAYAELAQLYAIANQWQLAEKYWGFYFDYEKSDYFYDQLAYSLVLAKLEGLQKSQTYLNQSQAGKALTPWEKNLKDFWLSDISEKLLLSKANTACNETEANFYIGFKHWVNGDSAIAKKYFNNVLDLKIYSYREYFFSNAILKNDL